MQSDDVFCDMINSIQFLNMSKAGADANVSYNDSGFNSANEMNADIFFYEDSCPPLTDCVDMKNDDDDDCNQGSIASRCIQNCENGSTSAGTIRQRRQEKKLTQIKVNVGIDEDLKMILEMDPSLIDETEIEKAVDRTSHVVDCPKILGLPPKM